MHCGPQSTIWSSWVWASMKPGASTRPPASTSRSALAPERSPIATIRSPVTPRSPCRRGPPLPSTRVASRMMRSQRRAMGALPGVAPEWRGACKAPRVDATLTPPDRDASDDPAHPPLVVCRAPAGHPAPCRRAGGPRAALRAPGRCRGARSHRHHRHHHHRAWLCRLRHAVRDRRRLQRPAADGRRPCCGGGRPPLDPDPAGGPALPRWRAGPCPGLRRLHPPLGQPGQFRRRPHGRDRRAFRPGRPHHPLPPQAALPAAVPRPGQGHLPHAGDDAGAAGDPGCPARPGRDHRQRPLALRAGGTPLRRPPGLCEVRRLRPARRTRQPHRRRQAAALRPHGMERHPRPGHRRRRPAAQRGGLGGGRRRRQHPHAAPQPRADGDGGG